MHFPATGKLTSNVPLLPLVYQIWVGLRVLGALPLLCLPMIIAFSEVSPHLGFEPQRPFFCSWSWHGLLDSA